MSRKRIARVLVLLLIGVALTCGGALLLRCREVAPRDSVSARETLVRWLRQEGIPAPGDAIVEMPRAAGLPPNNWVFAIKNLERPLLGGPAYKAMYLVGNSVEFGPEQPGRLKHVTTNFEAAFTWFTTLGPLKSEQDAVQFALCYAWLSTRQDPDGLLVLKDGEVPANLADQLERTDPQTLKLLRERITALRTTEHPVAVKIVSVIPEKIYTIEFCTYCPDSWGDIHFWHAEVGAGSFSASQRPIYKGLRRLM